MKAVRSIAKVVGWIAVGVFLLVGAFFEFGGGIANPPATWTDERAAEMADDIQDEFDVGPARARCAVRFMRERYDYDELVRMTKDEAAAAGERQAEALRRRCPEPVTAADHGVADRAYCTLLDKFYQAPDAEAESILDALIASEDGDLGPTLRDLVDQTNAAPDEESFNRIADEIDRFCAYGR